MDGVHSVCPSLTCVAALRLEFQAPSHSSLPLTFLVAAGMKYIWVSRVKKDAPSIGGLKGELRARTKILERTKFCNEAKAMSEAISYM